MLDSSCCSASQSGRRQADAKALRARDAGPGQLVDLFRIGWRGAAYAAPRGLLHALQVPRSHFLYSIVILAREAFLSSEYPD